MLKAETTTTRAPRGTKPVSQAFFDALDAVPEQSRAAVAKAAQAAIRDGLKLRKDKMKVAVTKEKARKAAAAPTELAANPIPRGKAAQAIPRGKAAQPIPRGKAAQAVPTVPPAMNGAAAPVKRRGRKPAEETAE